MQETIDYTSPFSGAVYKLTVEAMPYAYGGTCLQVYSVEENGYREPFATLTACLPHSLADDELAIRLYDGNETLFDTLVSAGVLEKPHRYVTSGYAEFPVCRLKN